ncbi:serine hydrolase domain-containing protein [Embleya sp. NPDC056575]|uniref:serine hydrolase domain-containing protein n=1 Tax=unclassified Embleya TaxID=2699296 RepID=UPI0036CA572D
MAAAVVALLTLAATTPAAASGEATAGRRPSLADRLDEDSAALVAAGATAAQVRVDVPGLHRSFAAGLADVPGGVPMTPDATFRIGSTTKTLVATVVLQLVGEARIGLDVPIEHYLPGLVPGGGAITVRQVLDHRSGLHDYVYALDVGTEDWFTHGRFRTWTAREKLAAGVGMPPYFAPGTGYRYSNTDYIVAGMLIERVTGRTYAEEVTRRVLRPLGLRHTSFPGTSTTIPGPHARAYAELEPEPLDVTEFNPSQAGASGEVLSTGRDLNRFVRALLAGTLLRPNQLREMKATLDTGLPYRYGLGLESEVLACGVTVWGHPGGVPGSMTEMWATADGRRSVSVSYNPLGLKANDAQRAAVGTLLADALCP